MKLTALLFITAILQVSAHAYGQRITFSEKNTSLDKVFDKIRKQTGFDFIFTTSTLEQAKPVSISLKNVELKEALELIFANQPLAFQIEDKSVMISPKPKSFFDKLKGFFATIEVKGKVIDENGKPLPRATIKVKNGSNLIYYTNDYGEFRIAKVEDDAILIISFLGYESREIKVAKELGNIQLIETSGKLQEVTVSTGYQQIDKSRMTGSISKVKAEDLVINGTTTLEQSLQGKIAGLEVVNNSGLIGSRQTVRVRGTSTLLGSQEPVWVVDGIIQEDPLPFKAAELNRFGKDPSNETALKNFIGSTISWLNPYDIQDITVLKDAASTAIYGVKAANGVIVINTKRGQIGRAPSVTYSNSFSSQSKYSYDKLALMNSKERVDVSREVWERGLVSSNGMDVVGFQGVLKQYLEDKISYDQFNSGVKQLEVNNTDWLDILFQTPLNQMHNIGISGGSAGGSYFGSFGYNNQKGLAKGNGQQGYTGNLSFTSVLSSKLIVTARISGSYSKTTGFKNIDPYQYATTTNRAIPAYNEDGSLSYYRNGSFQYNILNEFENSGNENAKTSLNANISARYQLPMGFRFESILGLAYAGTLGETYATDQSHEITARRRYEYGAFSPETYEYRSSPLPVGGVLSTIESRNLNYTWRNGLTYGTTINQKHSISGMMGMELRSNRYQGSSATAYGYLPKMGKIMADVPLTVLNGTNSIENTIMQNLATHTITDQKANYVSYYLTGGYTYDNRYVFSASVRGDASNRFGQDKRSRFKPVWALGARWNVAREHWFDQNNWFNEFSIRTSYGHQGNVAENYGPDLIAKLGGFNNLTGEALLNISTLPYTNLRMEKTQTIDVGLDFGFFKNRVTGSIDYYNKKSKDLIVLLDVPFENGVSQMPINNGNMVNSGFDVALNFTPVRNKDFTWTVGANFSKNYNNIQSKLLPNPTWNNATSGNYNVEGYPVSSFWVFDYKGLNAANGLPMYNIPTGTDNISARTDASAYMVYGGKLNADFTTGLNTSLRYKDLTFSTNMYLSVGGKKILAPVYATEMTNNTPNEYNNMPKILADRWRKPGDEANTNVPALPYFGLPFVTIPGEITAYSPYLLYNFSTLRVVDASYLRISNISLSYTLPASFCKRIYTKNISLGYTLSNPYTFVSKDYKGLDPEVASGSQPLPRIHVLNMAVTF